MYLNQVHTRTNDPELKPREQLVVSDLNIPWTHSHFQSQGHFNESTKMSKLSFASSWNGSDVVLLIEDTEFHVHRCILAHWSPVFESMFNSDFREKYENEIRLKDKRSDEIQEMLEVIYDRRKKITEENYAFLLRLADEFQMDQLLEECKKFLTSVDKSGTKSLRYIETTSFISMDEIRADCITAAKDIPSDVLAQCSQYHNLDCQSRMDIATARLEMLEELVRQYETTCSFLIEYLYESAHAEYQDFLRAHGLEETQIAKCENYDKHRTDCLGSSKRFHLHCSTCRYKVKLVKKFKVSTTDLMTYLQRIYDLIYNE